MSTATATTHQQLLNERDALINQRVAAQHALDAEHLAAEALIQGRCGEIGHLWPSNAVLLRGCVVCRARRPA